MAASVKSLTAELDKAEVLKDLYVLLGLFGLTTTALQAGEPIPVVLDIVVGWIVDRVWNPLVVPALRAIFLDYATGSWLRLVAWLIYNRPPIEAQAGTGPIDIENRSTTSGTVTITVGSVRVKNKTTGKTYTNTTAATVAQWSGSGGYPLATPQMTFEADEAGTGSNAQPGDISAYPTAPVTSPSVGLYAVTNAGPIIGSDAEGDASVKERARKAPSAASSSGPRAAYEDAARDPVGAFTRRNLTAPKSWGTTAPAISRVRVVDSSNAAPWVFSTAYVSSPASIVALGGRLYKCITSGTSASSGGPTGTGSNITDGTVHWKYLGNVAVFLASNSGPAGGDSSTDGTDVFKANVAIQLFVVPPGATCAVMPAVTHTVALGTITLYIKADSNVTAEEAIANAEAALVDPDTGFFSTLAISGARKAAGAGVIGYVYADKVKGVLDSPTYLAGVDMTFSDTALGAGDVAVPTYTLQANVVPQ
jgi:hypothetical protein